MVMSVVLRLIVRGTRAEPRSAPPGPRERWGWKGTTVFTGNQLHGTQRERSGGSWAEDLFGEEKGQRPSVPIQANNAACTATLLLPAQAEDIRACGPAL